MRKREVEVYEKVSDDFIKEIMEYINKNAEKYKVEKKGIFEVIDDYIDEKNDNL